MCVCAGAWQPSSPGLPIWWQAGVLVLGQASWFILILGHQVVRADLVIVSLEVIPETSLAEIWGRHSLVSLCIGRYLFPLNSFVEMRNECPFCNHCQDHWENVLIWGTFRTGASCRACLLPLGVITSIAPSALISQPAGTAVFTLKWEETGFFPPWMRQVCLRTTCEEFLCWPRFQASEMYTILKEATVPLARPYPVTLKRLDLQMLHVPKGFANKDRWRLHHRLHLCLPGCFSPTC